MKYLVTGGAGFIGSNLVHYLLGKGLSVRVLDDFSTGKRSNLLDILNSIELVEGDVQNKELVTEVLSGCSGVFHLAAMASVPRSVAEPELAHRINVDGTLNILNGMVSQGVKRIVFSASSAAYGNQPQTPKSEQLPTEPLSPYAADKLACEGYMQAYATSFGLETVSLRYFNVFGPRQDPNGAYAAVIPAFVCRLIEGIPPIVYGDGEQTRDFCYIENVCRANWLAMNIPGSSCDGKPINIGCSEAVSLNRILDVLARLLNSTVKPEYQPERVGDVRHSLADITRAKTVLGYEPDVKFEQGLEKAIQWYRQVAGNK